MKKIFLLIFLIACLQLHAQELNIIPKPVKAIAGKGHFSLTKNTLLVTTDEGEQNNVNFLNDYLQQFYGFRLSTVAEAKSNYIRLNTKKFIQPGKEGKYEMEVTPASIDIEGDTYQGTFYGVQTLIHLLPIQNPQVRIQNLSLPAVTIEDYPRFDYRGLHLDVGRHFLPVDFIKKYIDYIALHKMNYFHWHLTEDQGWRIEIKKYPRLTEVGAWRNGTIVGRYPGKGNDNSPYGGYYTQDEIKDVVAYASKRYIIVIPEIEMPGHSSAAIAAYPFLSCFPNESTKHKTAWSGDSTGKQVQQGWGVFEDVFCAGKDSTFQFLEDVLDEVITLFPSK